MKHLLTAVILFVTTTAQANDIILRPAQLALQKAQQVAKNAEEMILATDQVLAISNKLLKEIEKLSAQLILDDKARRRRDEEVYYTVSNKNFVVGAVGRSFSEAILAKAEQFRREQSLANGIDLDDQLTIIHVTLSDNVDRGWTLIGSKGLANRIWLTTNHKQALGKTLSDEILNVVLWSQMDK